MLEISTVRPMARAGNAVEKIPQVEWPLGEQFSWVIVR